MKIQFTVIGHPEPAGSKRAFPFKRKDGRIGVAVSDANPRAKDWKNAVASVAAGEMAKLQLPLDKPLLDGPLMVSFIFHVMRPQGHWGTGKKASVLKASAPARPTTRPDVLKLARGCEDSLSGVVWTDDSQIVAEYIEKRYSTPERVEIVVETL